MKSNLLVNKADLSEPIKEPIKLDLTIIGAGMAGLAAAIFATNRGISTLITGKKSSMNFATGLMDLMGVHPSGREWDNPWEAIDLLRKDISKHPYCAIKNEDISKSLAEIAKFLQEQGLCYKMRENNNVNVITSLGTVKKSYLIPESMWKGVTALESRAPTLIIDFAGMKIYSAKQIVATLSNTWQQLESTKIDFPGMEKLEEVYPEHIARALDIEENRIKLAALIKPLLTNPSLTNSSLTNPSLTNSSLTNPMFNKGAFEYVGFPALLGMYKSQECIQQLEHLLGISVFEIPTPPISVPGIRLHEALINGLAKKNNLIFFQEMVESVEPLNNGTFRIKIEPAKDTYDRNICNQNTIESKAIILATGRFMGKGLKAMRIGIRESLLNLPVTQPVEREMWHHKELFNQQGHPINRAGIEIDSMMRPLLDYSVPFAKNICAAGSILAHSDWTRMKCGSGVAIATAFASVKSIERQLS